MKYFPLYSRLTLKSIHCLMSSMGGCAPYGSKAGMFKSSIKKIKYFPSGGPKTWWETMAYSHSGIMSPLQDDKRTCVHTQTRVHTHSSEIWLWNATTETHVKVYPFASLIKLGVDEVLRLIGGCLGGKDDKIRDKVLWHGFCQFVYDSQRFTGSSRPDTKHLNNKIMQIRDSYRRLILRIRGCLGNGSGGDGMISHYRLHSPLCYFWVASLEFVSLAWYLAWAR